MKFIHIIILIYSLTLLGCKKWNIVKDDNKQYTYTGHMNILERGLHSDSTGLYVNYDTFPFQIFLQVKNDSIHVSSSDPIIADEFSIIKNNDHSLVGLYYFTTSSRPSGYIEIFDNDSMVYSWILAAPTGPYYHSKTIHGKLK